MAKTYLEMSADGKQPITREQVWDEACRATIKKLSESFLNISKSAMYLNPVERNTFRVIGGTLDDSYIPDFPTHLK